MAARRVPNLNDIGNANSEATINYLFEPLVTAIRTKKTAVNEKKGEIQAQLNLINARIQEIINAVNAISVVDPQLGTKLSNTIDEIITSIITHLNLTIRIF